MPAVHESVVLVTGANGGLGVEFVHQALARGAAKVYATARNPRAWDDPRIVPLRLDVTDPASIATAAATAADTTVLINNAGIVAADNDFLTSPEEDLRRTFESNFFGPVRLVRELASTLAQAPGRAAVVDVHSVASWYAFGGVYSASKAALWSATNSLRLTLAPRGVHVVGVHVGYVDTPMAASAPGAKVNPAVLVAQIYDAVEAGEFEVLGDELTANVKQALAGPLEALYPDLAGTASSGPVG